MRAEGGREEEEGRAEGGRGRGEGGERVRAPLRTSEVLGAFCCRAAAERPVCACKRAQGPQAPVEDPEPSSARNACLRESAACTLQMGFLSRFGVFPWGQT